MATKKPATKKPAARKSTTTRKPAVKSTAARKAPARQQTTVRTGVKPAAARPHKRSFWSVTPNRETIYWLILVMTILALGAWVLNLTDQVNSMYDQVEETQTVNDTVRQTRK